MSISRVAHDPSVRDYTDTSPAKLGRRMNYKSFSASLRKSSGTERCRPSAIEP